MNVASVLEGMQGIPLVNIPECNNHKNVFCQRAREEPLIFNTIVRNDTLDVVYRKR